MWADAHSFNYHDMAANFKSNLLSNLPSVRNGNGLQRTYNTI